MKILAAFLFALTLGAAQADAATLRYTISGNGTSVSFDLSDHPPLFTAYSDPDSFATLSIVNENGHDAGLTFYDDLVGGGLSFVESYSVGNTFYGLPAIDLAGPMLFSGTLDAPVLLTFGPTQLADYDDPAISYTISAIALGVPEPASWAMMLGGFALTGAALRRRKAEIAAA
jgi:hypothetical protein